MYSKCFLTNKVKEVSFKNIKKIYHKAKIEENRNFNNLTVFWGGFFCLFLFFHCLCLNSPL